MIIFKNDNIEKWNKLMISEICGTKMMRINPKTGKEELAFELNRRPVELLQDVDMSGIEMFDEIYELEETFSKMEDVYNTLIIKYNWSKIETQNLLHYLHLSLPKNENKRSIQLTSWKKWRDKEIIKQEFMKAPKELPSLSETHMLAKSIMRNGTVHIGSFLDAVNIGIENRINLNLPKND